MRNRRRMSRCWPPFGPVPERNSDRGRCRGHVEKVLTPRRPLSQKGCANARHGPPKRPLSSRRGKVDRPREKRRSRRLAQGASRSSVLIRALPAPSAGERPLDRTSPTRASRTKSPSKVGGRLALRLRSWFTGSVTCIGRCRDAAQIKRHRRDPSPAGRAKPGGLMSRAPGDYRVAAPIGRSRCQKWVIGDERPLWRPAMRLALLPAGPAARAVGHPESA